MVTLFSPWRIDTGRPAYSLDREGFETFYSFCAQEIESDDSRNDNDETSPLSTRGRQHVKDRTVVDEVFTILGLHHQRDLSNIVRDNPIHGEESHDANVADNEPVGFPTFDELNENPPPPPVDERLRPHILASHACGVVVNFGAEARTSAVVVEDDAPPGVNQGHQPSRTLLARQLSFDIDALRDYDPSRARENVENRGHIGRATNRSDWERISPTLNADQRRAAQGIVDVAEGRNNGQVLQLWHGAAGCGKTFLMNAVRSLFGPNECVVTAFSGKAACLHELGVTSHSLFGTF